MVLVSVQGLYWSYHRKQWIDARDGYTSSTHRRFKTLRAARRHIRFLLNKYPQEIDVIYRRNKDGYNFYFPATDTYKVLYGPKS